MAAHRRAVRRIAESYAALPPHSPPRLGKKTTNLFRFRNQPRGPVLPAGDLDQVLRVDPEGRTADVQGMTTYAKLVDGTLSYGLMPLVVPQLKTITLGGAVTGLGVESTSFRNGLPHESVREIEVLTGDGEVVIAGPDGPHADLFRAFPNSYGTLGYALRLRIELEPVKPFVRLRHVRFEDVGKCMAVLADICAERSYESEPVDFVDGTVFGPDEMYLTLASFAETAPYVSDYTGMRIYYASIRSRGRDWLTIREYLWRWDTDWFWCSRAFGVQHPLVRALWPPALLRSDVYRRLVGFDQRYQLSARLDRWRGRPPREPVIQDVEVPVERGAAFLDFFHRGIGISPIWICPIRLRASRPWPLYPLEPDRLYVNFGFWSTVPLRGGQMMGHHNRLIERQVHALDGHKSLYSTSYYPQKEFWRLYNGDVYWQVKRAYDAQGRLLDLYAKCVRGK